MYQEGCYKTLDPAGVADEVRTEGFDPVFIIDPPGRIYSAHTHPERKLLAFVSGSMEVRVDDRVYQCKPGDRLIIPGNVQHSAVVGTAGCSFFWSEKL